MLESKDQKHLRDAAISSGASGKNAPDGQLLQLQILDQLEKVNRRLDQVEDRMAGPTAGTQKLSTNIVTSTVKKDKAKKTLPVLSDSSSDESEVPSLYVLKSSKLQRHVDRRIKDLEQDSQCSGNEMRYKHK